MRTNTSKHGKARAEVPAGRGDWLVAIGASAGGPQALASILERLPADFPAAVVVAQHVDARFVSALADWLRHQSPLAVGLAVEGAKPRPGTVLLAARDEHLVFKGSNTLGYTRQPAECSYCPSVDVLFKSIIKYWPGRAVGVLLTGMGRDGAEGLRELRQSGHHTIVQNESSCAVYGMPKAAVEMDAAVEVLALDEIAAHLRDAVAGAICSSQPGSNA